MNLVAVSGLGALGNPGKIVGCRCLPDGTCQFVEAAAGLGYAPLAGKIVGIACDDDGRNCRMVQAAAGIGQEPPSMRTQTWSVLGLAALWGAGLGVLGAGALLASTDGSENAERAKAEGTEVQYVVINTLIGATLGMLLLGPLAGLAFVSGKRVGRREAA